MWLDTVWCCRWLMYFLINCKIVNQIITLFQDFLTDVQWSDNLNITREYNQMFLLAIWQCLCAEYLKAVSIEFIVFCAEYTFAFDWRFFCAARSFLFKMGSIILMSPSARLCVEVATHLSSCKLSVLCHDGIVSYIVWFMMLSVLNILNVCRIQVFHVIYIGDWCIATVEVLHNKNLCSDPYWSMLKSIVWIKLESCMGTAVRLHPNPVPTTLSPSPQISSPSPPLSLQVSSP